MRRIALALALSTLAAAPAGAQESPRPVSLRIEGKEVALPAPAAQRVAALARALVSRCGANSALHPGNFGAAAAQTELRWRRTLAESRLVVAFGPPIQTESTLGGRVPVEEAVIGIGAGDPFVGPYFTVSGGQATEHLQCEYLAALELACAAELAGVLPARYAATCARLERDSAGRIVLPPPDIAPSCS